MITKNNNMTVTRMKLSLALVFSLILASCNNENEGQVVLPGNFIYNRVNVCYFVSIERDKGNNPVRDSVDHWINSVVNDHLRWVYYADSTTCLKYDSKDFASEYRKYAYKAAQKYDKDLSACGNDIGKGEAIQNDSLKIYKTHETDNRISYTAEEYFCWGNTHPTRYKLHVVFDKGTGKLIKNELYEILTTGSIVPIKM